MKKNNQQRLILNIIILVMAAFILIFTLLGKFLAPEDSADIATYKSEFLICSNLSVLKKDKLHA